jgi:predicted lipid-binding transport protein (Tim44 family)
VVWRIISHVAGRKPGGREEDREDDKTYDVTPGDDRPDQGGRDGMDRRSRTAQAAWEYLTGEKGPDLHSGDQHEPDAPGTFNEREFLRGAKMIYGRIRQSLAMRNLADLRQFAAPDMMREFERIASEKPDRESLVVMLVEARVTDLKRDGRRTDVEVAYEATVSDDPKTNASHTVSEVWRFSRDETVADAKWLLESMETSQ